MLLAQIFIGDQFAPSVENFLNGAAGALSLVAALFFLRFYRKASDRLFLYFAAAFAILGLNRVAFLLIQAPDEARTALYAVRLVAFLLILYAIIDKNRTRRSAKAGFPVEPGGKEKSTP